MEIEATVGPSS